MSETSTAVARRDGVASIGQRSREVFDPKQAELIRTTVAKDCSDAELGMFLELCARYELDPFAKEIYAAKMGGKDGSSGRVAIIVGRDGLLKIAQRTGEFDGIEGDVIRKNDEFTKRAGVDLPEHSYGGDPEERGDIVAAWATVYRRDRKPTYFYAPLSEYMPGGNKLTYSPWSSQKSAMILKCAESMALRKAFSITGLVAEEEMGRALEREVEDAGMTDWGTEPTIAAWLPRLFTAANEARPNSYRPAKVRVLLRGRTDDEREELAAQLVEFITEQGGEVPERPSLDSLTEEVEVPADETEVMDDTVPEGAPSIEDAVAEAELFPHPGDPDVRRGGDDGDEG